MVLIIQNSKDRKIINKMLNERWECSLDKNYVLLKNEKGKLFVVTKDFSRLHIDDLKLQSVGIYFGEIKNYEIRLSIEGSQLIGNTVKKNIAELNELQINDWTSGKDIDYDSDENGFLIIRHNSDYYGSGKYSIANKKIFNFVPKERRISPILSNS